MNEHDRHLDLTKVSKSTPNVRGMIGYAYQPEQEEAQQVPRRYARSLREVVGNVIVPISEDTSHKYSRNSAPIVCLRCEIDDGNNGSHENVETGTTHTRGCANIDGKADKVLDCTAAVEYYQNSENQGTDYGGNHPVPPEQAD